MLKFIINRYGDYHYRNIKPNISRHLNLPDWDDYDYKNTPAIINAAVMVIAPEPTAGPIALATSLAPMPHVMKRPNNNANPISTGP